MKPGCRWWSSTPAACERLPTPKAHQAKTDPLDATVLADFGRALRPPVRPLPSQQAVQLTELTRRRRQLIQMITAEQHRLDQASTPLAKTIGRHITWLQKQLKTLDANLAELIRKSPLWCDQAALIESVPGVGPTTTAMLLSALPESYHLRQSRRLEKVNRSKRFTQKIRGPLKGATYSSNSVS